MAISLLFKAPKFRDLQPFLKPGGLHNHLSSKFSLSAILAFAWSAETKVTLWCADCHTAGVLSLQDRAADAAGAHVQHHPAHLAWLCCGRARLWKRNQNRPHHQCPAEQVCLQHWLQLIHPPLSSLSGKVHASLLSVRMLCSQ